MSNTAIRLTLRQKPHLDFVLGHPGLVPDADTKQASLEGTVEVRVQNPVHTQWLKVELKKTEVVQTSKGIRKYFEEQILWNGKDQESADADKFAPLDTSDHSFAIPIPPGLPPTIVLDKSKNTGIVYHLVATAMIKVKSKGLFGGSSNSFKPPTVVTQIAEVTIEKHELNPSWPIYLWQAETTPLQVRQANLSMQLKRETVIFGGNDPVKIDVDIKSERNAPIKITRIEMQLKEIVTTREADVVAKGGTIDPKKTLHQTHDILSLKSPCHNVLYQNESMSHSLSSVFPPQHHRFTVQNAKHLDVKYAIRVRAVVEVPKEAKLKKGEVRAKEEPIKEIVLDNVAVIISPWNKKQAEWWRTKIGHIPSNLQRPAPAAVPMPHLPAPVVSPQPSHIVAAAPAAPSHPPPSVPGPSGYGASSAAAASRAFSQRVQQGNQLHSSQNGQTHSNQASPPLQPVQPSQPLQIPQAQQMTTSPSNEERRALAIEQGKRLSSWPPPPRESTAPTIAVTAPESRSTQNTSPVVNGQLQQSLPMPGQNHLNQGSSLDGRQTKSEIGHGTMYWQPTREVASLDGHAVSIKNSPPPQPYHMDGAYPLSKSASLSQGMSTMGYANPWSPPPTASHRRVFSDGAQQMRHSSQPLPDGHTSTIQDRRLSSPVLASSIPINTRQTSNGTMADGSTTPKKRMHIETTQGGFPARKNTLSTITGSAPSSQQSSPTYETYTAPMPQTEWASAEQEKERLYNEATERARRTQERAGNTVSDPQYRSVQDRTPTPLSLLRSVSNPSPSRHNSGVQNVQDLQAPTPIQHYRHSTASTHLGYLNADPQSDFSQETLQDTSDDNTYAPAHQQAYTESDNVVERFDPSTTRRASLQAQHSQRDNAVRRTSYQSEIPPPQQSHNAHSHSKSLSQSALSPLSPSMSWSGPAQLDAQKMAYLKALAAREAYQQRMSGAQPEPLTALEEKRRLQRLYEEEEGKAGRGENAWQPPDKSQQPLPEVPEAELYATQADSANASYEDIQARHQREFTPASSVYLTPDTTQGHWQNRNNVSNTNGNGLHNPYFESPNSSSTHLVSDGSSLSHSYSRNPAISKGKQRRQSTYRSELDDSYYESAINGLSSPPSRPPKTRDIIYDTYKHFDTPVSPSAEEYERRLLWSRSQSSHHGH